MIIDEEKRKRDQEINKKTVKTEEPFFKNKNKFLGLFSYGKEKVVTAEELEEQSPLLLYITEDMEGDVYKNVRPGVIKPKDKWGKEKGNENLIQSRKLIRLNYDGKKIPIYIHYEKERFGFPQDVRHDNEEVAKGMRIIQANYKEYEEKEGGFDWFNMQFIETLGWTVGGGILIFMGAIYLGNIFGVWETLGWFGLGS